MLTATSDQVQLERLIKDLSQLTVYTVGRSIDNAIVIANGRISGKHARLIACTPDTFLLEDLDSKNGSFVDAVRITRKVVHRSTAVRIADADFTVGQLLDLRKLEPTPLPPEATPQKPAEKTPLGILNPEKATADKLDFTGPFAALRQVCEQYPKLRKDCRNREKMVRTGSILLSSIVGISAAVSTGGAAAAPFLLHIMSGAGLSMLLPTLCSTLLSTEEKLEVIDKEYRERYRCPNPDCRDPFQNREWESLAQQKTCRRCQAIWVA